MPTSIIATNAILFTFVQYKHLFIIKEPYDEEATVAPNETTFTEDPNRYLDFPNNDVELSKS